MKKLLLTSALLLSTAVLASDYNYEVTPLIGYNIAEGNINLDDYAVFGAELQYNGLDSAIAPELSIFYSKADYEGSSEDTNVCRLALNGVYEFDKIGSIIPLAKAGVGYEKMSDTYGTDNTNSPFIDAGVGAKIPFSETIALKLEAIYMNKYNDDRFDNNLMITAGLNIAFGKKAQKEAPVVVDGDDDNDGILNSIDECPTTPTGDEVDAKGCTVIIDGDDDNDGVLNSIDECSTTPAGEKVDAKGCKIDGDDDNDGVLNSVDECPTTPAGDSVDAKGCTINEDIDNDGILNSVDQCPNTEAGIAVNSDGCPRTVKLNINFENNSDEIKSSSFNQLDEYSKFLKEYIHYSAKIIGYTDSRGSASYNQKLSEKRANAVVAYLVENGVNENQLSAEGKGEANPIADNSTSDGRAQNRRIEAELTKN